MSLTSQTSDHNVLSTRSPDHHFLRLFIHSVPHKSNFDPQRKSTHVTFYASTAAYIRIHCSRHILLSSCSQLNRLIKNTVATRYDNRPTTAYSQSTHATAYIRSHSSNSSETKIIIAVTAFLMSHFP